MYLIEATIKNKLLLGRRADKEAVVYVYNGIFLSHRKRQIPTICFNVVGTGGDYAE